LVFFNWSFSISNLCVVLLHVQECQLLLNFLFEVALYLLEDSLAFICYLLLYFFSLEIIMQIQELSFELPE
jgi:hypothetical protein